MTESVAVVICALLLVLAFLLSVLDRRLGERGGEGDSARSRNGGD